MIGSLFSGIGGLELGLERAGLGPVAWQAEMDPWCRRVLTHHWPHARRFGSVQEVKHGQASRVSVVCGGFPCQPVSVAGKRRGADDDRWLWPEMRRVIAELDPEWVVIENVPGLRTKGLGGVLADLAALGRDAEWIDLRASDVGAPHRRARLFVVAHRDGATLDRWRAAVERAVADVRAGMGLAHSRGDGAERGRVAGDVARPSRDARDEGRGCDASGDAPVDRCEALAHGHGHGREREREARLHADGARGDDAHGCDPRLVGVGLADSDGDRLETSGGDDRGHAGGRAVDRGCGFPPRPHDAAGWRAWVARGLPEPVVRGSVDGVPDRLDRLAALGNAVVPLVAEVVGRAIVEAMADHAPLSSATE